MVGRDSRWVVYNTDIYISGHGGSNPAPFNCGLIHLASLQVGSALPAELLYSVGALSTPPPALGPSQVFIGGADPSRSKYGLKALNFIGSIGLLKINGRNMEFGGRKSAGREEGGGRGPGEATLHLSENQCSRDPCRNGGHCRLTRWDGFEVCCPSRQFSIID